MQSNTLHRPLHEAFQAGATQPRPQILLIQNKNEFMRCIVSELHSDFAVSEVLMGEDGVSAALELRPDLIISDTNLPGMSGYAVCHAIKNDRRTSHIPIILISANSSIDNQIAGWEAGADAYVTTSVNAALLKVQVTQMIHTRRKLYSKCSQDPYIMLNNLVSNEMDKEFLEKIVSYIDSNLRNTQLSVDSIAGIFNVSRSQIYRKIKSLTHQSVVEFIRTVRLKYALKLMEENKYNFSEIADQAGFNSLSYFTRSFKDQYGKAPSEFLEGSRVYQRRNAYYAETTSASYK